MKDVERNEWNEKLKQLMGITSRPSNTNDDNDMTKGLDEIICMIDQLKRAGWSHEQAVDFVCRLMSSMKGGTYNG